MALRPVSEGLLYRIVLKCGGGPVVEDWRGVSLVLFKK